MEDLVWEQLDAIIANQEVCDCNKCRLDIASLALNSLPPRYIVTSAGETYARIKALEYQFKIDIITAITQAIQVVRNNPRHDTNKD